MKQELITRRFIERHPQPDSTLFTLPDYQLTFDQFCRVFAKPALELSGFRKRAADYLLIKTYRDVILEALTHGYDHIAMDGINSVRFLNSTNRSLVGKYLVSKGRSRFE